MASNSKSCPICMDSFGDPNDICSTICGHIFHYSCFLEWQERSNTCPLCNRSNPAPHRIYIDINDFASPNNEAEVNKIIIKNIPPNLLKEPFSEVVLELARCMNVSMREHDIGNVFKIQNSLEVTFKMSRQMEIFLSNKYKLKKNGQTSMIGVHEALDVETKKLFDYAHKLKNVGYTVFFIKQKKVYIKRTKTSQEIHISTKEQVDTLSKKPAENVPTTTVRYTTTPTSSISLPRERLREQLLNQYAARTSLNTVEGAQTHRTSLVAATPSRNFPTRITAQGNSNNISRPITATQGNSNNISRPITTTQGNRNTSTSILLRERALFGPPRPLQPTSFWQRCTCRRICTCLMVSVIIVTLVFVIVYFTS